MTVGYKPYSSDLVWIEKRIVFRKEINCDQILADSVCGTVSCCLQLADRVCGTMS
jgi:hypothetical protein